MSHLYLGIRALPFFLGTLAGCAKSPPPPVEVSLADAGKRALAAPLPRTTVRITPRGIDVDDIALVASWPRDRREAFLRSLPETESSSLPFSHERIINLASGKLGPADEPPADSLELRPLVQVLEYAADLEMRYAAFTNADKVLPLEANVYLGKDASYGIVGRVLFSVGIAGYQPAPIVHVGGVERVLPIDVPRYGEPPCPAPEIRFFRGGIAVRSLGATPSGPNIQGSCVRPQDPARLEAALRSMKDKSATCGRAFFSAAPDTPWQTIVDGAAVAERAGFDRIRFEAPNSEMAAPDGCKGASQ